MSKFAILVLGILVMMFAVGTAWADDDDDDDDDEGGKGRKILQFHAMAGAPGITAGAPTSITFETLNTNCGQAGTLEFFLNGVSLGSTPGDPNYTCTCSAPTTTFVVNDAALIGSAWQAGQSNELRFVRTQSNFANALAWSRAVIHSGGQTETVCLFDFAGGNCNVADLCAANYTWDSIDSPVSTDVFFTSLSTIRGIHSAAGARSIKDGKGHLKAGGELKVDVSGLVLAADGSNPDSAFKAIVSCLSRTEENNLVVVNLETDLAAANGKGNAKIKGSVELPASCMAPIIFVTGEDGFWRAVTGR
ncbi:MAG: hypothetical protein HY342_13200 [Candidatus Lambdaproteobacteria bacterium]|nr:hypothetical protein [Candidatus Lambdaproteobacteria bacterium]